MTKPVQKSVACLLALTLLLLGGACHAGSTSGASKEWDAYVGQFLDSYFTAHPDVAIIAGRHEFDGKLPDWSAEGIRKEIQRLHAERERATAFSEKSLDARQRFEREYLVARVDQDLFWLETVEWPFRNPKFYGDALDPNVYVSRPYASPADRLRAYTNYARAIPTAAAQIQGNLRLPLPRVYIDIGHVTFGGLAGYYEKDVPIAFGSVSDAESIANFRVANAGAIKAMKDLDAWLKAQEASATDKFAIGPEKFSALLKATERVDMPLAQVKEIGERDLERNLSALKEAVPCFCRR